MEPRRGDGVSTASRGCSPTRAALWLRRDLADLLRRCETARGNFPSKPYFPQRKSSIIPFPLPLCPRFRASSCISASASYRTGLKAIYRAEDFHLSVVVEALGAQLQRRFRGSGQFWQHPGLSNIHGLAVLFRNNGGRYLWN